MQCKMKYFKITGQCIVFPLKYFKQFHGRIMVETTRIMVENYGRNYGRNYRKNLDKRFKSLYNCQMWRVKADHSPGISNQTQLV